MISNYNFSHNFEETKQTLIKAKKSLDNAVNKKKKKKIKRSKYNNPEELSINEELESTKPWYEKVKRKLILISIITKITYIYKLLMNIYIYFVIQTSGGSW